MVSSKFQGVLGSFSNRLKIDMGTLALTQTPAPRINMKPVEIALPSKDVTETDDWSKKYKLGSYIYHELGLAGQIARKFLELPYRKGKGIAFNTGKLKGKGLVCTSFAKIFGALWFDDVRDDEHDQPWLEQEKLGSQTVEARPRRAGESGKAWKIVKVRKGAEKKNDVVGETDTKWEAVTSVRDRNAAAAIENKAGSTGISLSPALVYADKFGGTRVNEERLRLKELVDYLDRTRLYAMLTYASDTGANPKHVWFLLYYKGEGWLRIESTGSLGSGGVGAGPGIYRLKQPIKDKKKFYQAWDWGHWYKPENPDIEHWDYN